MSPSLPALVSKELRQTFRDPRMVVVLVMAPMIQLVVLGFAVNLDVDRVPTVLVDQDHTRDSRDFLSGLTAGDTFDSLGHADSGEAAVGIIERGEAPLAVIVPRGFSRDLDKGEPTAIQVLVDGGDSNRAIVAQNAVTSYVLSRSLGQAMARVQAATSALGISLQVAPLRVEPRLLYNPTLDSKIYFVPGVAATLLLVVTMIVTAMGLAREKEMGTLEQVMVTPIGPVTLILGKTLPYAFIGLVDLGLVIGAGTWIFDVPIRGDLGIIFLAGSLYLLTVLGFGLLLSTIARNQQQAFMGALFFIMPAILLSGFMTPVANMPDWLRPLSGFDPVRHFVEVLRAVLLKDATMAELAPQLTAMAGMGVTVYLVSAYVLHRSLR